MNYLITGGEFNNKGAEAMTLTAIKNIYENDPDAVIYMFSGVVTPDFEFIKPLQYIHLAPWLVRRLTGKDMKGYRFVCVKDLIKSVLPGYATRWDATLLNLRKMRSIDVAIDVSGYGFGSKWPDDQNRTWLEWRGIVEKYAKKLYFMPQSFGPLDFESPEILSLAKKVFSGCAMIYAREESGARALDELGTDNIRMPDSVLLEKGFDPSLIIKDFHKYEEAVDVKNEHNIAIIPNMRLVDKAGIPREKMVLLYSGIIDRYVKDHDLYLIAHSGEDLKICREIKDRYPDDERIVLIDHVMYSFNYESFVKKMDFIIASRYHSIIHAYKEYVPAVIMGWADKYRSLASDVGQTDYIADPGDLEKVLQTVDKMVEGQAEAKKTIQSKVERLQERSCYDFLRRS